MLLCEGRVERVQEREAGTAPNTWTERTLVVVSMGRTEYVTVARDFGVDPATLVGTDVLLEVGVRTYLKRDQSAGWSLTGFRVRETPARGLRAASAG